MLPVVLLQTRLVCVCTSTRMHGEFLDCSKCADNIKTERSIFARRRLAGHTATIEINVIQVKQKQSCLQAHRETEAHFIATGMSSQNINPEALRFKRAAFYNGLKSKVGLAAAKAAALRINLNVQGCSIVAPPMHAPSRTPLLLPLLLSHNLPTPRVH